MLAHWDEVESGRAEAGHVAGLWTDLGSAAGTKTAGVSFRGPGLIARLEDLVDDDGEPR